MRRWRQNPMGSFMRVLAAALETESKSAETRRKGKERASKRLGLSHNSDQTTSEFIPPPPSVPASTMAPPTKLSSSTSVSEGTEMDMSQQHKRTASAATTASFGGSSTDSPPQNIDRPEPHVQNLQNTFVQVIMENIWGIGVPIPWAQGRKMWLDYTPYLSDFVTLILLERIQHPCHGGNCYRAESANE